MSKAAHEYHLIDLVGTSHDGFVSRADSDDPGQGFQLKAATIPIEGGQYWPVGMFMGSQRW
jgi:hypothetical protein